MDPIWFFILGAFAGSVLGYLAAHLPLYKRIWEMRDEFRAHEAEIARRNAELDERIKHGCRQRPKEQK